MVLVVSPARERTHTQTGGLNFFRVLRSTGRLSHPWYAGKQGVSPAQLSASPIYISQRASEWGFGNARGRSRDVIAERESASMRWGLCFRALYGSRRLCSPLEASSPHHSFPPLYIAALEICCEIVDLLSRSTPTRTQAVGVPFKCHPRPRLSRVPRCVCVCVCIGSSGTLFLPAKFRHFPGPPYDS